MTKKLTRDEVLEIDNEYADRSDTQSHLICMLCSTALELMREVEELGKDNYILKEGEPL